jgi:hypothetical protein
MPSPGALEGQEVEGSLALVCFGAGPRIVSTPVFMGSPDEEEEAHWAILEEFRNLAERSL